MCSRLWCLAISHVPQLKHLGKRALTTVMLVPCVWLVFCDLQVMRAIEVIRHTWPGTSQQGLDAALVLLPRPVQDAVPILLPDEKSKFIPNTRVMALGHGLHYERDKKGNWTLTSVEGLQSVNLQIVDNKFCPSHLQQNLTSHLFCAYDWRQCSCKGKLD